MDVKKIREVATKLATDTDSDFILYNGGMERPFAVQLIDQCRKTKRRSNVLLFLCTHGGDASAAYRIARYLQEKYKKFTVCICGTCKSAGTLLAVGAHEIVITDQGEMGPLDVQVGKKDELWETDSGLTVLTAISALEAKAFDLFETCFLKLKSRSGGRITLKTATDLATKLAIGTISPIVSQIDPMHIGEVSRANNIGVEYGNRLAKKSKNALTHTVDSLTNSYPSHGFVIDRSEAKSLFAHVRDASEGEAELIELLGYSVREPNDDSPLVAFISKTLDEIKNETDNQSNAGEGAAANDVGAGGAAQAGKSTEPIEPQQVAQLAERLKGKHESR